MLEVSSDGGSAGEAAGTEGPATELSELLYDLRGLFLAGSIDGLNEDTETKEDDRREEGEDGAAAEVEGMATDDKEELLELLAPDDECLARLIEEIEEGVTLTIAKQGGDLAELLLVPGGRVTIDAVPSLECCDEGCLLCDELLPCLLIDEMMLALLVPLMLQLIAFLIL